MFVKFRRRSVSNPARSLFCWRPPPHSAFPYISIGTNPAIWKGLAREKLEDENPVQGHQRQTDDQQRKLFEFENRLIKRSGRNAPENRPAERNESADRYQRIEPKRLGEMKMRNGPQGPRAAAERGRNARERC